MKKLHQLISEKESELQNLEDSLGLGFPIVEQAKMTQISHLRLELEDLRQIEKSIQLNDNQKIVLDVLKKNANQGLDELIVGGITYMSDEEINAIELSQQEELFQVLAAFAEWGMKGGNKTSDKKSKKECEYSILEKWLY